MAASINQITTYLNELLESFSGLTQKQVLRKANSPVWQAIEDTSLIRGGGVLVSVIMTTYNNAETLQRAVKSIVEQKTQFKFELLIGVDTCADNTLEIAKKCQLEYPDKVRVFSPSVNVGYQANRDYLHKVAKASGGLDGGGYFAYCEADDAWDMCDTKLAEQIALLESHSSWVGCVGSVRRIKNNVEMAIDNKTSQKGIIRRGTIGSRYFHTTSYVFRRTTYERCHRMAPNLPTWMDILILIGANTLGDIGYWSKIGSTHYITQKGMYTSLSNCEKLLWELPYYCDWLKYCKSKAGQNLVLGIIFRIYRRKGEMTKWWETNPQLMRKVMQKIVKTLPFFSSQGISARLKLLFSKQYR